MKLLPQILFAVALVTYSCTPSQLTIEDESPKLDLVGPNGFCIAKDENHLIEKLRNGKERPNADIKVQSIRYHQAADTTMAIISFTILPDHQDQAVFFDIAD